MADDITKIIEETSERTAEKIRKDSKEAIEEIKHHMDVVAEDLKGQIQQVAEGVETNTQHLERIDSRLTNLEPLIDDVEAIKVTMGTIQQDIGSIKHNLKQKVDREEFSALELKLRPA